MGNLMKNGVSYTGSMLGGSTKTFKGILEAGETSISFVDTLITGNSTIDYETSKLGVNPTNIEVANNAVTFTFAAQAEDISIKVTISNDAAEPAPTKMRFLKATGQQYIELSDVRGNEGIKLEFYGYLADYTGGSQGIFGTQWARDCLCVTNSIPSGGTIGIEWERQGATDLLTVPCNKPIHFVFDTNGELRADEQVITFTPTTYTNKTIKLFCGGDNGGYKGNLWASEMKIYKNNVLVKDLIPTKINGVPCYYDVIGRKPYFSETSTPFQLEELDYTPTNPNDPRFVETVIATNPNVQDIDISFTDSWNNYDLLKIELASYADPTAQSVYFYTTPKHINTIANLDGVLRIYVADYSRTYSINTSTLIWTTFASGNNWCIKEVKGLKCNNCVFTEDQIFIGTTAGSNQQVEIISQNSLFTYDLIFVTINDGNYTRCTPSENVIIPIKNNMFNPFVSYYLPSSNYPATVKVSENKLSAARYMYVTGVRFT